MTAAQGSARSAWAALALAATLAACTAVPTPEPGGTVTAPVYVDDPAEIAALRQAAGLAACPDTTATAPSPAPADSARLPALTLQCLGDGPEVNLADLGGVPYVVNVWAGWCEPCRDEMPHLQEVYERAGGTVGVIGVDFQDTAVAGLSAAAEFGITFPSVQDLEGDTRTPLRFQGPPFTAFVSADGEVVATHVGQLTSADQLRDLIAEHLGVAL